jgi:hypothetical protein
MCFDTETKFFTPVPDISCFVPIALDCHVFIINFQFAQDAQAIVGKCLMVTMVGVRFWHGEV